MGVGYEIRKHSSIYLHDYRHGVDVLLLGMGREMSEKNRARFARECDCQKGAFVYPKPLCACDKSLAQAETPAPDYGPWIGWMGNACPLHLETIIEAVTLNCRTWISSYYNGPAHGVLWWDSKNSSDVVVAYRIIKEYKEPRELYIVFNARGTWVEFVQCIDSAKSIADSYEGGSYAKFREVIDETA